MVKDNNNITVPLKWVAPNSDGKACFSSKYIRCQSSAIGLFMNCFSGSKQYCKKRSPRMLCLVLQGKTCTQQTLRLTVPEGNWSSEGLGDLIPHEDKWQLINDSTYLFRGGVGFDPLWRKCKLINHSTYLFGGCGGCDPLWREVEVNQPFKIPLNIFVLRGRGIWSLMKKKFR